MRLLLLLILFGVSTAIYAQETSYYLTIVPKNNNEVKLLANYDSAAFQYVRSIKASKLKNEKLLNLSFNEGSDWWMQLQGDKIDLDDKDLTNEHEAIGYWDYTYNTLRVSRLANIYLHDTTTSIPYDTTIQLNGNMKFVKVFNGNRYFKNSIELSDYRKLIDSVRFVQVCDIITNRIIEDMHIVKVNDTLLLSEYVMKPDTSILPHINLEDAAMSIQNVVVNGHIDSYVDWTFLQPYDRSTNHYHFTHTDTIAIKNDNPDVIYDTIIQSYISIKSVKPVYRWAVSFSKFNPNNWNDSRYITFTRVPYAVGLDFANGKKVYVKYNDGLAAIKNYGHSDQAFAQCLEVVFFKSLKLGLNQHHRITNKKK